MRPWAVSSRSRQNLYSCSPRSQSAIASSSATSPRSRRSTISPSSRSACSNVTSLNSGSERSLGDLDADPLAGLDLSRRPNDGVALPHDRIAAVEGGTRRERAEPGRLALQAGRLTLDGQGRRPPEPLTQD